MVVTAIRQTSSDRLIVTLDEAEEIKTTLGVVTEHRLYNGAELDDAAAEALRRDSARALARDPEILVFDDSFSALDYRTDATLRGALAEQMRDATKIIVAQRIGTIRHADQIIVLDHGRAVGIGTHKELMQTCTVYQEIARSQLSAEELEREAG